MDDAEKQESKGVQQVLSMRRMDQNMLKRAAYASCFTTCGLLVIFILLLVAFGAIISAIETPEEIKRNLEWQTLITELELLGANEAQLELIADFSGREVDAGLEGFSTFDGEDDWSGANFEAFSSSVGYVFDLASTIGYGEFTPQTTAGRAVSLIAIVTLFPLAIVTYTKLANAIMKFVGNRLLKTSERYKDVIKRYDQEGLGKLDRKELYLVFSDLGLNVTAEQVELILAQYDFNEGDMMLDEQEFKKMCVDLNIKIGILARETFQLEFAAVAFVLYVVLFTVVTFFVLEEEFFDSFYFVIVTVSTVGLGDVVPPQRFKGLFSILAFVGIAFTALLFRALLEKFSSGVDLRSRYFHRALRPVFDAKNRVKSFVLEQPMALHEVDVNENVADEGRDDLKE